MGSERSAIRYDESFTEFQHDWLLADVAAR